MESVGLLRVSRKNPDQIWFDNVCIHMQWLESNKVRVILYWYG
jgi:hypothetical protein